MAAIFSNCRFHLGRKSLCFNIISYNEIIKLSITKLILKVFHYYTTSSANNNGTTHNEDSGCYEGITISQKTIALIV